MSALAATRVLLLVGDTLSSPKFYGFSRISPRSSSLRSFSRTSNERQPLTLASLGFRSGTKTSHGNEKNKLSQGISTIEFPKKRENKRSPTEKTVSQGISTIEFPKKRENKTSPTGKTNTVNKKKERPDIAALAPFAAKSFSELGLPPLLVERLEKEGYKVPTDVQAAAIPAILKDHDAVIQSYTGSGKTLAYVLPILSEVGPLKKDQGELRPETNVEAVVVAPSRELGMQIVREFEKLLGPDKRLVQQLVGGANKTRQEEALRKNKPVIVVGTPGRVAEISASGKLHTHNCRFLVLDEVDELLAFNFREDLHRIVEHVGRKSGSGRNVAENGPKVRRVERRTIMVSATVPFSVVRAARSWGCDPLLVQAKSVVPIENLNTGPGPVKMTSDPNEQAQAPVQSLPPSLTHYYSVTRIQHKVDTLRRCVHALDAKCVIAFMNHTKQLKDAVFKLEARGMKAAELHGDLGKLGRSTILKKFRNGEVRVLLTNELSARGLDIPECDLVVNLGLPTDPTHYAHRAGRTGRLGRRGTVVTICEESEVFIVKKVQKQLGIVIEPCEFAEGKLVVNDDE
ncbi:hypothetical protein CASFOL_008159 [Castilleja foliolosa]|uniref:RNA helicase n=1 Tax=Castilleja foliolosa TaxID=1961234 RepID=A0ABD3DZF6_9LAMI